MAKTVLVTGASGLLGRDVVKAFERKSWNTVGTAFTRASPPKLVKLDLLDETNIKSVLEEVKPQVIVHCAANRFPDSCANDPDAAARLNVSSTKQLTQLAKQHGALLIYISTDYVFPGRPGEAPYKVTDKTDPPNVYGVTKRDGELAVLEVAKGADGRGDASSGVVLRVPLLYGHCEASEQNKSAVHPLIEQVLMAQDASPGSAKAQVDDYALRFPTCTEDVGRVLEEISSLYLDGSASERSGRPQILQFSGQAQYTKYEMAKILAGILGAPTDNLEAFDPTKNAKEGDTQRPYDSHLDVSVLKELGIDVSNQDFTAWWRRDLRAFRH